MFYKKPTAANQVRDGSECLDDLLPRLKKPVMGKTAKLDSVSKFSRHYAMINKRLGRAPLQYDSLPECLLAEALT